MKLQETTTIDKPRELKTKGCAGCRHAVELVGAYTGTHYLECSLEAAFIENATQEQLLDLIQNPDQIPCEFAAGTPADGGITYDD